LRSLADTSPLHCCYKNADNQVVTKALYVGAAALYVDAAA